MSPLKKIERKMQRVLVTLAVIGSKKRILMAPNLEWQVEFKEFQDYLKKHCSEFPIQISKIDIKETEDVKYVGGLGITDDINCGIPNSSRHIISYNKDFTKINRLEGLSEGHFKWTGGGIYKGKVYCFPRKSNALACYDYMNNELSEIELDTHYREEHHYGGVLTEDGMLYQPPRNKNHILVIDLNTMKTHCIYLFPKCLPLKFRYCGSVYHPNGFIYFLPERWERVIKFNPVTEEYQYIGKIIKEAMVFSAVVAEDGNIYGYGLYNGMLKIDVYNEQAQMLFEHLNFGCYGSKLGVNGKIYGIPGNGTEFWEYDLKSKRIRSCGTYPGETKAKCAGGFTASNGDIHMMPASGRNICVLRFGIKENIPSKIYNKYFIDNY